MLGSRLMVQAAKAQPPGASDSAAAYVKGARTPAGAPLNLCLAVQGSAAIAALSRRMA